MNKFFQYKYYTSTQHKFCYNLVSISEVTSNFPLSIYIHMCIHVYTNHHHYYQPLSIHFRMTASPRCFQSALFSLVLLHFTPTNLTISSLQRHCNLFFGIQYRTLVIHLPSFLLVRCTDQFHFNFFTLKITSVILVCSLIYLFSVSSNKSWHASFDAPLAYLKLFRKLYMHIYMYITSYI